MVEPPLRQRQPPQQCRNPLNKDNDVVQTEHMSAQPSDMAVAVAATSSVGEESRAEDGTFDDIMSTVLSDFSQQNAATAHTNHQNAPSSTDNQLTNRNLNHVEFDESDVARQSSDNLLVEMFTSSRNHHSDDVDDDEDGNDIDTNINTEAESEEFHVTMDEVLGISGDAFTLPDISELAPFMST